MDIKKAKELSTDAIYEIKQMVNIIDDQTQEIEFLEDKIVDMKDEIEELTETPKCPTENVQFEGEYDFYEK